MELYEEYEGRDDCLIQMTVNFGNIEKKFGPADTSKVSVANSKVVVLHCTLNWQFCTFLDYFLVLWELSFQSLTSSCL